MSRSTVWRPATDGFQNGLRCRVSSEMTAPGSELSFVRPFRVAPVPRRRHYVIMVFMQGRHRPLRVAVLVIRGALAKDR